MVDGGGPAVSIADDLEAQGVAVERLNTSEVAAACACFYDAVADAKVKIRTSSAFDGAAEGLARRPVADRFLWSRSTSAGDITPIVAATLAYERALHNINADVNFYSFG